ncbi:hypothetical protein PIB30_084437 [Stylosanthes scabra]|uniref:Uncharacterized protein n=1 Tax=Stylosanthes scabra TaxID=79078 RepID=A0ABU6VR17_9FABA|nr:hypothetical protein [Stylosanthes scabra]
MLIIYLHETHFGEYSEDDEARPPWISYWRGDRMKERLKLEKKDSTGLLSQAKQRKERMKKKKKTTDPKRVETSTKMGKKDILNSKLILNHNQTQREQSLKMTKFNAAAENERRSKHRHEVNVEEIQPPPNAEVNPAGAEIIANAEAAPLNPLPENPTVAKAAPLNPLPENPAAAAPIETLPPIAAPAVAQINQLAENADAAVDPPSQGVAAIDDVLVTPQDCEIEVVEATSAEEELISR